MAKRKRKCLSKKDMRAAQIALAVERAKRLADPFYVVGRIPKGISYQWCALSVLGSSVGSCFNEMKDAGWRPVPARRHPRMPHNSRGQIVLGGQILMERAVALTIAARGKEVKCAHDMYERSTVMQAERSHGTQIDVLGTFSADFEMHLASAKETHKTNDGAVPISIRLALTGREVETAVALGLTVEQYALRKVLMRRQYGDDIVLQEVRQGVFDFSTIKVHHTRES